MRSGMATSNVLTACPRTRETSTRRPDIPPQDSSSSFAIIIDVTVHDEDACSTRRSNAIAETRSTVHPCGPDGPSLGRRPVVDCLTLCSHDEVSVIGDLVVDDGLTQPAGLAGGEAFAAWARASRPSTACISLVCPMPESPRVSHERIGAVIEDELNLINRYGLQPVSSPPPFIQAANIAMGSSISPPCAVYPNAVRRALHM